MTKLTKILANKGIQNACFCGVFVILATLFIGNAECASSRGTVARRTQTVARTQPVKKQNDIKTTETLRSDTLLNEDQQEEDDSDNTTTEPKLKIDKVLDTKLEVAKDKDETTTNTVVKSRDKTTTKTEVKTKKQPITVKNPKADTVPEPEPEPVIEEQEVIVENKTSLFDDILGDATSNNGDTSRTSLAEQIRAQRAALDAADAAATASANTQSALATGKNTCDQNLRACMKSKCGNDFSKCAGDTDTTWGDKMDACRRDLPCSGEEYRLFATEIKADRDLNAQVAAYNSIVSCGNRYNDCIITECGTQFTKCLGKSAGDSAISKCAKIAKECQEQDSGLASRAMSIFGTLRQDAEKTVKTDEEKLYSMRDAMRNTCERLGAMFDDRSLDCVYTINFYAGEDNTLFASKKAYAGSTFNCHQDWFGIDVTTFKENAFRLTRAQKAASSAMLGGGLGTAVGAVTSGALDRSIERQKAEQRAKNDGMTNAEKRRAERAAKKKDKENGKKKNKEKDDAETQDKNDDQTNAPQAESKEAEEGQTETEQQTDNAATEEDKNDATKAEQRAKNDGMTNAEKRRAERAAKKKDKENGKKKNKEKDDAETQDKNDDQTNAPQAESKEAEEGQTETEQQTDNAATEEDKNDATSADNNNDSANNEEKKMNPTTATAKNQQNN